MKPHKSTFSLLFFAFLIFTFSFSEATIRYVSKTGSSSPPYTSWATATDSIQKAINISLFGDTIYVANGVYKEQIIMIPGLSLIGAGMDSCVVDTRSLTYNEFNAVTMKDSCTFTGFLVIVSEPNAYMGRGIKCEGQTGLASMNKILNGGIGIYLFDSDITIEENTIQNSGWGMIVDYSSSLIRWNVITSDYPNGSIGIDISDLFHTATPRVLNNYVEASTGGIKTPLGTHNTTIANNVVVLKDRFSGGLFTGSADTTKIFNNLIILGSFNNTTGIANTNFPKLILNNTICGAGGNLSIGIDGNGIIPQIINNLMLNTFHGIERYGTGPVSAYYNNAWNNVVSYKNFVPDSTNLSVDPMVMNKDSLDFRLQMFSPIIDAGDPNILDKDGSRSDIGLFGGPNGEKYTYRDLAPRPPANLTAIYDSGFVKLMWKKNTEADFKHYRVYRDTTADFMYDTTKIVGVTADSFYYDDLPEKYIAKNYYYKITALDNTGNQSAPSEEITVNITGAAEAPPIIVEEYKLLNNYPNPFNPSTIIPYRLKEGGNVKLTVHNLIGELVAVLIDEYQEKGYYEVVFRPTNSERERGKIGNGVEFATGYNNDMASGIYIYSLRVSDNPWAVKYFMSGKMILLK